MAERRISVIADGRFRPPLFPHPILSSSGVAWRGFLLEQHQMPSRVEFPASMKFPGHLLATTSSSQPPMLYWRENGRARSKRVIAGNMTIRSSQDLIACRQEGGCTLFSLLMTDSLMEEACAEAAAGHSVELIPDADLPDPIVPSLLLVLIEDLRAGCPAGRLYGESLVHNLAAYVARHYSVFPWKPNLYRNGLSPQRLRKVLEYIHANLSQDLGISEIAGQAFISPYYFGKLFKQSTGRTVHQYVLHQRMQLAQSLLCRSRLGLAEIAGRVGMSSQSHFTTAFKNRIGVTPAAYRNHLQAGKHVSEDSESTGR
jgi:AraC family transcriptional regulator